MSFVLAMRQGLLLATLDAQLRQVCLAVKLPVLP
jgi:hypothetical protein